MGQTIQWPAEERPYGNRRFISRKEKGPGRCILCHQKETIYHCDDDRDGHRNVGILRTPNAADSPRRLYQKHCETRTD
jgi:hypothetical protein